MSSIKSIDLNNLWNQVSPFITWNNAAKAGAAITVLGLAALAVHALEGEKALNAARVLPVESVAETPEQKCIKALLNGDTDAAKKLIASGEYSLHTDRPSFLLSQLLLALGGDMQTQEENKRCLENCLKTGKAQIQKFSAYMGNASSDKDYMSGEYYLISRRGDALKLFEKGGIIHPKKFDKKEPTPEEKETIRQSIKFIFENYISAREINSESECFGTSGWTPVHYAASIGDAQVLQWFILRGANINKKDFQEENTPLHIACAHLQPDAVRVLLSRGATKDELNKHRIDPLGCLPDKESAEKTRIRDLLMNPPPIFRF